MKPFDCTGYSVVYEGQLSEAQTDAITALVTNAIETQEAFIFQTLQPFCEKQVDMVITKEELIQALTLYREQKEKGSGWIRVDERLPETYVDVLVCNGNEFITVALYDGERWMEVIDEFEILWPSVTHWMPLPEPPEEVVEND